MQRLFALIVPLWLVTSCTVPSSDNSVPKFSDVPPPAPRPGVLPDELPASARTNLLAFHLVAESVPLWTNGHTLHPAAAQLSEIRLQPEPIISDADLVAWDLTNYTFVITPAAAKRLISKESKLGEFVLMTSGQPIYLGTFLTMFSSSSYYGVPVILTDSLLFFGKTNYLQGLQRYAQQDPRLVERWMALIAGTNVTLKIDLGYPNAEFKPNPDIRDDQRIAAAVERRFGKVWP